MARGQRLDREDVEAGVSELPRTQRLDHRRLVDQRAARGVDEQGAAPHRGDPRRRQEAARLVGEQQVERDRVALGKQALDGDELDAGDAAFGVRFQATTFMPMARAMRATSAAMPP